MADILLLADGRDAAGVETRRTRRDEPDKITTALQLSQRRLQLEVLLEFLFQIDELLRDVHFGNRQKGGFQCVLGSEARHILAFEESTLFVQG